jgi:threonylcarbamoyladenosine tRNA methylthiotransferase MtaB
MEDVVSIEERRRRNEMLRILSEKKRRFFYEQHLGETHKVLFEQDSNKSLLCGFTENYIKIERPYHPELVNEVGTVQLNRIGKAGNVEVV